MAKKTCNRAFKGAGNHYRKHEALPDEIALKDEILNLKRQIILLKRANEQYLVKLRKFEEEAKRKDKQLEQLMNPRKNSDITKVLSTKGVAILMNLKDQNDLLIQMLLNKDLHIRRLMSEIKMSKLYTSTKRNESYKAEISRLRNMLLKSEETLKETIDMQQHQQEQMKSICVSHNPFSEFSFSSDQSSPRDLEELRCTILSLETHIKSSSDLLAQKNKEICLLTDELNFLRKSFRCKEFKHEVFNYDNAAIQAHKLSTKKIFPCSWPDLLNSEKLSRRNLLDFLEKNLNKEQVVLPHSAPDGSNAWVSSNEFTSEHQFSNVFARGSNENNADAAVVIKTVREHSVASILGKSLFHTIEKDEMFKEEKILSRPIKQLHTKRKWKQAVNKYKEIMKLNSQLVNKDSGNQAKKLLEENEIPTTVVNVEAYEFEKMEKNTQSIPLSQINRENTSKKSETLNLQESFNKNSATSTDFTDMTDKMALQVPCQNFDNKLSTTRKSEEFLKKEIAPSNQSQLTEKSILHIKYLNKEIKTSKNDSEEIKANERKSLRQVYCQSLGSSFDSESGSPTKSDVQKVLVKVQINSIDFQNYNDHSENRISEGRQTYEFRKEAAGNNAPHVEFNAFDDDDDVVVR